MWGFRQKRARAAAKAAAVAKGRRSGDRLVAVHLAAVVMDRGAWRRLRRLHLGPSGAVHPEFMPEGRAGDPRRGTARALVPGVGGAVVVPVVIR